MRIGKTLVFCMSLLLVLVMVAACAQVNRRPDTNNDTRNLPQQTRVVPRTTVPRRAVPGPAPLTRDERMVPDAADDNNRNYISRSEAIANQISKLPEIESATCVISGNTAMVGVQFDEQYKGKVTNAIKKKVETASKKADQRIERVVVSADPDVLKRLQDILRDVGQGKPISGFAEELNELFNRMQPK